MYIVTSNAKLSHVQMTSLTFAHPSLQPDSSAPSESPAPDALEATEPLSSSVQSASETQTHPNQTTREPRTPFKNNQSD